MKVDDFDILQIEKDIKDIKDIKWSVIGTRLILLAIMVMLGVIIFILKHS